MAKDQPEKATAKEINKLDDEIAENLGLLGRLKRKGNEGTLLAILLLILGIVVLAIFVSISNDGKIKTPGNIDPNSPAVGSSQFDFSSTNFIPKFSDLRDVVFFNGSSWVASNGGLIRYDETSIEFFGLEQGLTGEVMTSLAVTDDSLWVAYQGGVARYQLNDNNFVSYLDGQEGVLNPHLYYDEVSDELMLSTFEDFYVFNARENAWELSVDRDAPINSIYFASDNSGVYAVNDPNAQDGGQIVKYSRSSGTWRDVSPSQINGAPVQLFNVGDKVVAMGEAFENIARDTQYIYRDNTIWRSIDSYNANLSSGAAYMVGPRVFDTRNVRVEANGGEFDVFELTYTDQFEFNRTGQTTNAGLYDETLFDPITEDISQVSGLRPEYRILGVDSNGEVIAAYKDSSLQVASDGVVYLRQAFNDDLNIASFDSPSTFIPIMCDGKFTHAFTGTFSELDGAWQGTTFYEFNGRQLVELAEFDGSFLSTVSSQPEFICAEDYIYFVGPNSINRFVLASQTVREFTDVNTTNALYKKDDDKFIFFSGEKLSRDLEVFEVGDHKTSEIKVGRDFDGRLNVAFENGLIWIPSPRTETIHVYDLNGADVQSLIHEGENGVHILNAGPENVLVVQATDTSDGYRYFFVNSSNFSAKQVKNVPVHAALFSEDNPIGIYQPEDKKVWISGLSSSVFSLSQ